MLALKIDDKFVDLPDDFSFTMNLKSPVFGEIGSYSYPFLIPTTSRNATILNFGHRVESTSNPYLERQGMFTWNGVSLFEGTVKLKSLNLKTYEGSLFEGVGDFNYKRKNASLYDVDFGLLNFTDENQRLIFINACANTVYPQRDFAFPQLLNQTYFDNPTGDQQLRYFNFYDNSAIRRLTPGGNRSFIVPMLYLRFVLKKIFETLSYQFDDSFFSTDIDYNSLVLYNSVDCNGDIPGFFGYEPQKLYLNYHVPRMGLNDFFSGLESFFNIRIFVNKNTVRLCSVDAIVKSADYVDFSKQIILVNTELEDQVSGFHLKMEMDTDDDLYTAAKVEQDNFLKRIKSPVQSVSDLKPWPGSDPQDIRFVHDENQYYVMNGLNGYWMPVTPTLFEAYIKSESIYKNDDQSIGTKFSSLMNEQTSLKNCIIGNAREDWSAVSPKLFFVLYQNGGYGNLRTVGRNDTDTKSLFYGSEKGLFNKYYKAYFDFRMSTKLVKITSQMTFQELNEFSFEKKIMVFGIKYLVKSIQVTIKKDRIMPALMECYVCQ